jgi:hypothetical protein
MVDGRVFRWWAINIPLDLLPGSGYFGDIDLMVCTLSTPKEPPGIFYKTWEVKLMLVDKSGKPHSLKSNKTEGILNQLKVQRKFGSPDVSLLELYLHEAGSAPFKFFPTADVFTVVERRAKALKQALFGYQVLPFRHAQNQDREDFGIATLENPFSGTPAISLVRSLKAEAKGAFLSLAQHLNVFAETESRRLAKTFGWVVIAYCRTCRKLCLIHTRDPASCYHCSTPLAGHPLPPLHDLKLSKYLK